ncbi:ATP-binding protein [Rhodococcus sp. UFZ-B548]|uniref:ATP-binding protein n=1 Tax=Rhodococcus sp. UFZ-B548 TaxID=2742212 RepID=UPI0015F3B726|nr:ATP-binding protein [Rhodococcus sp. UFZ-B548]
MTTRFRINSFKLDTTEGPVAQEFPSDLTVLAGPTGVGKTALLELLKFGFGCEGRLAAVAEDHVDAVTLDVSLGDARLLLRRSLDPQKRKIVRVTDLITQERLPDHNVGATDPSLNTLLLAHIGLQDDLRAAAGGTSTREGSRVSFADILTFLYIPQYEINRDIAKSQDSYLEPKRKVVFELLFDLIDPEILDWRSRINLLKKRAQEAEQQLRAVTGFLHDSNTTSRAEAEQDLAKTDEDQSEAQNELVALRESIDPITDRRTQVLRDLLGEAERSLAAAKAASVELSRRNAEYTLEQRRVKSDLDRLGRMREAGLRMANIEFTVCPRCTQKLSRQHIPADTCRLCLQPDLDMSTEEFDQYEARQLNLQLIEMDEQIRSVEATLGQTQQAISEREHLVTDLAGQIDDRTADRVTPRLQAFSDASQRVASARAKQEHLEATLRQWDVVEDLQRAADALIAEREQLSAKVKRAEDQLKSRRREIVGEISDEFSSAVAAIGIPAIESATVDPDKYLPVLNGKVFTKSSQFGGGVVTATQVAYWSSLLAVALRRRDTMYPAFLMIDSPRLALNTATEVTERLYRRLVSLAEANPGRVQFVIADNELPSEYRGAYDQIDFDYSSPTIDTIAHPGPAGVVTVDKFSS